MNRSDRQHHTSTAARGIEQRWPRRIGVGVTAALSLAALAACGSSSSTVPQSSATPVSSDMSSMAPASPGTSSAGTSSAAGASQPAAQPAVITISKFAYAVPESVSPGAMITVMNKDGEAHTVTADSGGAFDDKATPGASTQFQAPSKPGSYPFHCTYHSNMHGVLVVK